MTSISTSSMTQGPISRQVIMFALPLFGTSIIQQLYGTVDLLFAGNVLGTESCAAVGISNMLVTCITGLFIGISAGVNVILARLFGAHETKRLCVGIHTSLVLAVVGSAVALALGVLLVPFYLSWMSTPADILDMAKYYLYVYCLSIPAVVCYNIFAGISRGVGNSSMPMIAQFVGGIVNIAGDAAFTIAVPGGVAGIAVATLFSQSVAALVLYSYVRRTQSAMTPDKPSFSTALAHEILWIGIPTGLQTLVISLSNILIQWQIDLLGIVPIAAFTIYFKVELVIYYTIVAIGQTAMTFVSANLGAGNVKRALRGMRTCLAIGVAASVALAALLLAIGYWTFWIFDQSEAVIQCGIGIIRITFPLYWTYVFLEVLGDTTRAWGDAVKPMVVILVSLCLVRTALLLKLMKTSTAATTVAMVFPITWILASVLMALVCRHVIRSGPPGLTGRAPRKAA